MIDNGVTDGEHLCRYLNHRLLASAPWEPLATALEMTGRASQLVGFYRQLTAVTLSGRIVVAGKSLADRVGIDDPAFRKEFTALLRDYVGIPARFLDELFRFSHRAVNAALEPFRKSVQDQMLAWAKRVHPNCYMCGVVLNFEKREELSFYTCEHVWPRSYGGNSAIDNLLPACRMCNERKKANFATWVMPSVQALILGLAPSDDRLQEIPGSYKFAIHYRAAQELAMRERLTLKNAFLKLGPWEDVRIRDVDDVVDIFNIENHTIN